MTAAEVDLLERWSVAFAVDAHIQDHLVPGYAAKLIAKGLQLVWEVDGERVYLRLGFRPVADQEDWRLEY